MEGLRSKEKKLEIKSLNSLEEYYLFTIIVINRQAKFTDQNSLT
jgi:hypothetical protein